MRMLALLSILALMLGAGVVTAEDGGHAPDVQAPLPPELEAPPPNESEAADEEPQQLLTAAELDQLVAPIALYPDTLLAQVMMASTYPLEIVEADRFVKANPNLNGEALEAKLVEEDWDDSVKSLVETPEVLAMMSEELDWLQALGDAVLAQQADVLDAVQRLRALAEDNGKLQTTQQQTVTVNRDAGQREIIIQPASPEVLYVPYYEPQVVYGPWPYPDYPPYYFDPAPGYVPGGVIASGIAFGVGYALSRNGYWDDFDWRRRHIRVYRKNVYNRNVTINRNVYNRNVYKNINRTDVRAVTWQHNAYHRRGVKYKNPAVQHKYGNAKFKAGKSATFKKYRGKGEWPKGYKPDTSRFSKTGKFDKQAGQNFGEPDKNSKDRDFKGKDFKDKSGYAGKKPDFGKANKGYKDKDFKAKDFKGKPGYAGKKPDFSKANKDFKAKDFKGNTGYAGKKPDSKKRGSGAKSQFSGKKEDLHKHKKERTDGRPKAPPKKAQKKGGPPKIKIKKEVDGGKPQQFKAKGDKPKGAKASGKKPDIKGKKGGGPQNMKGRAKPKSAAKRGGTPKATMKSGGKAKGGPKPKGKGKGKDKKK